MLRLAGSQEAEGVLDIRAVDEVLVPILASDEPLGAERLECEHAPEATSGHLRRRC